MRWTGLGFASVCTHRQEHQPVLKVERSQRDTNPRSSGYKTYRAASGFFSNKRQGLFTLQCHNVIMYGVKWDRRLITK